MGKTQGFRSDKKFHINLNKIAFCRINNYSKILRFRYILLIVKRA